MLIDLLIGLREGLIIVLLKLFLFINNIVSWFVFKRKKHKNKKRLLVMVIYISFMKMHKHWMYLQFIKLKLKPTRKKDQEC